jgi:hypothetical protein
VGRSDSADVVSEEFRSRVDAAVRYLRDIHHVSDAEQRRMAINNLAEVMLWLRKNCRRRDQKIDLHGQSRQYKEIVGKIRTQASGDDSRVDIPTQVNHKINELLFQDPEINDETRSEYGFGEAPAHITAQRRWADRRSRERATRRSGLIEDVDQLIKDVEQLQLSKLDDADDVDREKVVERLSVLETRVRERQDEIGEIF